MADDSRDQSDDEVSTLDDDIMAAPRPAVVPPGTAIRPHQTAAAPSRVIRLPERVPPPVEQPGDRGTDDEQIRPDDHEAAIVAEREEEEDAAADDAAADENQSELQPAAVAVSSAFKVGLLGGKQVGKSYLFQSMVYRTRGRDAGALSSYLGKGQTRVYRRRHINDPARTNVEPFSPYSKEKLIRDYEKWKRLPSTSRLLQYWYRLHLPYRTGWLGRRRAEMEICFFDGSGDHLQSNLEGQNRGLWKEAFVDARVLIFCLPMWAAFPDESKLDEVGVSREDATKTLWQERDEKLAEFHAIVHNYEEFRRVEGAEHTVHVIVVLTQADSALCEPEGRGAWITPYIRNPRRYLQQLRSGRGVARYLANARGMSRFLIDMCDRSQEKQVSELLNLDYGCGTPWFVPVTAIEGTQLDRLDTPDASAVARIRSRPPVPAHVELPLLIALCEQHNALA